MPYKCVHVIKRAFDYGSIEREELETKGQHETFTVGRNVNLVRALPSYRYRLLGNLITVPVSEARENVVGRSGTSVKVRLLASTEDR